jgi:hypothetical protein
VRKTEKVESLRFSFSMLRSIPGRKTAKFDDPRLVGVQFQTELRKPLAQFRKETPCFAAILKPNDKIIRKTDDYHVASRLPPSPPLDPKVEYIVQVDIRQQRADTPALNRT